MMELNEDALKNWRASDKQSDDGWDIKADIVVVGGGTGQLAAVAAALKGLKVVLLEKRRVVGGAMAFSGGNAWLANTEYSQKQGDSYAKAKAYLKHMQMGFDNEEIVNAYLNNTQKVIEVCKQSGIELRPLPRGGEYQPNWEGAQNEGGRSCQVLGDNQDGQDISEAGGRRMNNAFMKACKKLGVVVLTQTSGSSLITKQSTDTDVPEVEGLVAVNGTGDLIRIKANKGVILATGGFEWNEKLVKNYLRVPMRIGAAISWPENTGDAVKMTQTVGADMSMMNHLFGMPFFVAHAEYAKKHHVMASMAGNAARASVGSIVVDKNARRFVREDSGYMSFVNAFGGYNNFGDETYTADPAWWLCDQRSYDKQGGPTGIVKSWGFPDPNLPEDSYVFKADSLAELADKIHVNAEALIKTVTEYNHYAAQGIDPLFHRGEQDAMGVKRQPVVPMETGPYYAVALCAGAVGTLGGPRLNENAQVLHTSGKTINGLYAMGNCAGVGGPGPSYGGEGGTIGPAFALGVAAVEHASQTGNPEVQTGFINTHVFDNSDKTNLNTKENEFIGSAMGIDGPIKVKITVEHQRMTNVEIIEQNETTGIGEKAIVELPNRILAAQSTQIDTISGASVTNQAIISAVNDAMNQAGLAVHH